MSVHIPNSLIRVDMRPDEFFAKVEKQVLPWDKQDNGDRVIAWAVWAELMTVYVAEFFPVGTDIPVGIDEAQAAKDVQTLDVKVAEAEASPVP